MLMGMGLRVVVMGVLRFGWCAPRRPGPSPWTPSQSPPEMGREKGSRERGLLVADWGCCCGG